MTTATLNIAKNLTVVADGTIPYMTTLSNVVSEANKYSIVNLNGLTKTSILDKYLAILIANGYVVTCENWRRDNCFDKAVSDFSIQLQRVA